MRFVESNSNPDYCWSTGSHNNSVSVFFMKVGIQMQTEHVQKTALLGLVRC